MAEEKSVEEKSKKRSSARKLAAELRYETVKTFSTLMISAFGLVAAFAWNEVVKEAISRYIAPGSGLRSMLYYAIIVTLLAVFVSYQLGKLSSRYKIENEEAEEKDK